MCNNPIDNNSLVMICAAVKQNTLSLYCETARIQIIDNTRAIESCHWNNEIKDLINHG